MTFCLPVTRLGVRKSGCEVADLGIGREAFDGLLKVGAYSATGVLEFGQLGPLCDTLVEVVIGMVSYAPTFRPEYP